LKERNEIVFKKKRQTLRLQGTSEQKGKGQVLFLSVGGERSRKHARMERKRRTLSDEGKRTGRKIEVIRKMKAEKKKILHRPICRNYKG